MKFESTNLQNVAIICPDKVKFWLFKVHRDQAIRGWGKVFAVLTRWKNGGANFQFRKFGY